ncbi:MAG: alpha-glucosidase [Pelolinea sp.]|nr:alpha-glucosidase [Pelolinea sp.]
MKNDFVWWRDGVIYQIYPRSFKDSTGSGIGDLKGITEKLDYLSDLGIDAIWLSPINPSPDVDFGYDVSDYCAIDPKFGTMQDFEHLIAEADKLGIRIVMDLVLNHTSDQHPWFKSARRSRDDSCRDWYIWQDADPSGKPPNNWHAVFGGSGWEWDSETEQYYYHMFYKQQPDLNWRNPQVRNALLEVFRFWLDKGVKGFRLDVFNMYIKDDLFRNNPTKLIGRRPFERQIHLYDFDRPELMGVLSDIRQVVDAYADTYVVGETFLGTPEKAAGYCGEEYLHACFDFNFLESKYKPQPLLKAITEWENALGGSIWPNYVCNNHDNPRTATRFGVGEDDERLKVAAALILTLRGTPFLYYGEEIGMRDIRLKRSDILDPIGKRYWPIYKGRDGCRAPMQWNAEKNAGFSSATPWLPVHPDYLKRNAENQTEERYSLLNFYKQLLVFRKTHSALIYGDFQVVSGNSPHVLAFKRSYAGSTIMVILNFSDKPHEIILPEQIADYSIAFSSIERTPKLLKENSIGLSGSEVLVLVKH